MRYWILAALALGMISTCWAEPPATTREASGPSEVRGVSIVVTPDREEIQAGEALHVAVTLRNRGDEPVRVLWRVYDPILGLSVFGPDGKAVRRTTFGEQDLPGIQVAGRRMHLDIPPGQQASYSTLPTACFDLTRRGEYTVQAQAEIVFPESGRIGTLRGEARFRVKLPESSDDRAPVAIPAEPGKGATKGATLH